MPGSFSEAYVPWWLGRSSERRGVPRWSETFLVGWAGVRGVVSLATALALPAGDTWTRCAALPGFCVTLLTLVGQGLSLQWLIRILGGADEVAKQILCTQCTLCVGHIGEHAPADPAANAPSRDRATTQGLLEHLAICHAVIEAQRGRTRPSG